MSSRPAARTAIDIRATEFPAEAPADRPAPVLQRKIGPSERLSATLALSLISFGVLILGVGFSQEDAAPVVPTLDVILTQTSTPEPPKQADFIAQSNNRGGGDRDKAQRPRDDQVAQIPKPQPGVAAQPLTAQAPPPAPDPSQRLLATVGASVRRVPLPEEQPTSDPLPLPTGRELMQQSAEMARLAAEIERRQELYARRPKRKFISASTQQYEYAAYMRTWVQKVERIGNLNFPEDARRQRLTGWTTMTVSVGHNGEVKGVVINYSSGKKLLDTAAVRIVHLAGPFAPLPQTGENIDILEITRTFHFKHGNLDSD